ncbi:hypothetical protein ASF34_20900 [Methylobacterium sp. Leaf106]|nr:hypothetical protein ASF34_20900 [Methylobacterium sp. Leaf106]TXN25565.1 hypothetical protein FV220_18290 [Methylobacterium sp. WL19]
MSEWDASGDGTNQKAALLNKLATALDCPVSAFSESSLGDPTQTAELLRLWAMVDDEQDRLNVLSFIRSLAHGTDARQSC